MSYVKGSQIFFKPVILHFNSLTLDTWTMAAWSKNQNQESSTGWTWLLKSI